MNANGQMWIRTNERARNGTRRGTRSGTKRKERKEEKPNEERNEERAGNVETKGRKRTFVVDDETAECRRRALVL